VTGGVKYSDFGHGVHGYIWSSGRCYYFKPAIAAGIDVSEKNHDILWKFALRYDFGNWY